MKKNDVFTFTAPNGVEVTAVVLHVNMIHEDNDGMMFEHICYAQNRLFTYYVKYGDMPVEEFNEELNRVAIDYQNVILQSTYGEVLVDYCILPDYDAMLERYNDLEVAQAETQSGM